MRNESSRKDYFESSLGVVLAKASHFKRSCLSNIFLCWTPLSTVRDNHNRHFNTLVALWSLLYPSYLVSFGCMDFDMNKYKTTFLKIQNEEVLIESRQLFWLLLQISFTSKKI